MVRAVLSLFLLVTKRLYGKDREWSIGQIKTSRKKQHVEIDDMKVMSDLFCGKAAVGGNYNSTRDSSIILSKKCKHQTAMKNIAQGFAVEMGGSMEGTCGALIGATCVFGLINQNPQKTMKATREMMLSFKEQNRTVVCKELKGLVDGRVRRECIDCVRDVARLMEAEIE